MLQLETDSGRRCGLDLISGVESALFQLDCLSFKKPTQSSHSVYNKTIKLFALIFKEPILARPPESCRQEVVDYDTDNTDTFSELWPQHRPGLSDAAIEPDPARAVWSFNQPSRSHLFPPGRHNLWFDNMREERQATKKRTTFFLFPWLHSPPLTQSGPTLALKGRLRWLMCS